MRPESSTAQPADRQSELEQHHLPADTHRGNQLELLPFETLAVQAKSFQQENS